MTFRAVSILWLIVDRVSCISVSVCKRIAPNHLHRVIIQPVPVQFHAPARPGGYVLTTVVANGQWVAFQPEAEQGVVTFHKARQPGGAAHVQVDHVGQGRCRRMNLERPG